MKTSQLFQIAFFINMLGSAMTWTGLPAYFAKVTNDNSKFLDLFFIKTLCSLLFILVGGYLADWFCSKKMAVGLNLVNMVFTVILCSTLNPGPSTASYISLVLIFIVSAMLEMVETYWFLNSAEQEGSIISGASTRLSWVSIAKIAGMCLGPVLFSISAKATLYFDALSFFIAAVILGRIPKLRLNKEMKSKIPGVYFTDISNKRLVLTALLSGLVSIPLINFILLRFIEKPTNSITVFWVVGCFGLFFSGMLLKKLRNHLPKTNIAQLLTVIFCLAVLFLNFTQNSHSIVLICLALVTLTNPALNVIFSTHYFEKSPFEKRGRISSLYSFCFEIGTLLGLFWIRSPVLFNAFPAIVIIAVLMRSFSKDTL